MMGLLLSLLVAEKSGFQLAEHAGGSELRTFTDQVTRQAMESIQQAVGAIERRAGGSPWQWDPASDGRRRCGLVAA